MLDILIKFEICIRFYTNKSNIMLNYHLIDSWPCFDQNQLKILTSVVKVPRQIFFNFMFFGSFYPKISCPTGIFVGISNQSYCRFWSGVWERYRIIIISLQRRDASFHICLMKLARNSDSNILSTVLQKWGFMSKGRWRKFKADIWSMNLVSRNLQ